MTMYQIIIRPPITKLFNKENNILEWANSWRSSSQINKKLVWDRVWFDGRSFGIVSLDE